MGNNPHFRVEIHPATLPSGFGLRFVQYQYINNEFGLDDVQTGSLLGVKSTMDIIFGILGSLLTDAIGVKKTATAALCSPPPAPRHAPNWYDTRRV